MPLSRPSPVPPRRVVPPLSPPSSSTNLEELYSSFIESQTDRQRAASELPAAAVLDVDSDFAALAALLDSTESALGVFSPAPVTLPAEAEPEDRAAMGETECAGAARVEELQEAQTPSTGSRIAHLLAQPLLTPHDDKFATPQALSWPTGQQPGAAGSPDPADHELSGSDWVLEEELGRLRIVELRRRAVAAKVDPAELESARDDDDPKGAMVTLLLRHLRSPAAARSPMRVEAAKQSVIGIEGESLAEQVGREAAELDFASVNRSSSPLFGDEESFDGWREAPAAQGASSSDPAAEANDAAFQSAHLLKYSTAIESNMVQVEMLRATKAEQRRQEQVERIELQREMQLAREWKAAEMQAIAEEKRQRVAELKLKREESRVARLRKQEEEAAGRVAAAIDHLSQMTQSDLDRMEKAAEVRLGSNLSWTRRVAAGTIRAAAEQELEKSLAEVIRAPKQNVSPTKLTNRGSSQLSPKAPVGQTRSGTAAMLERFEHQQQRAAAKLARTAEALAYETQTSPRTQRLEPRARRTLSAAKLRELSTPKQTDEPRAVDRMQSDPQDGLQPPSGGVNHDVLFRQQAADGLATAAAAELSEGMAEQAIDKYAQAIQLLETALADMNADDGAAQAVESEASDNRKVRAWLDQ